jgi:hypothetical protein
MGEQREILEHQANGAALGRLVAALLRHHPPVDQHPPGALALDPGGDPERCRLAAARGAEQTDDLAGADLEAEVLHRRHAVEMHADPVQLHAGLVRRLDKVEPGAVQAAIP